jgi:hypothetical protein
MVNEADKREEDGLTCGGFDDCGLANTSSVKIDVGSFFGCFSSDI